MSSIGHEVTLYGRAGSARMQRFLQTRKNDLLELPPSIALTTDLRAAQEAEVIIISIGSQGLRALLGVLVTPVLPLGLPLVCWLLEPQQRLRAGTRQCGIVVGGSLTWGVGYLLCWASKWVLAGLVTGQNVIADALHQVGVRTAADSWHGMELTWGNILHFVYTTLAGKHLFWPLVLAVVLLLALFAASIRDRQQLTRALPLGLCALMTPAWFIVLRTHSIQHGWFTWRALGLTVFAGLAFLYYCCDVRQIAKRLKRT